MCMGYGTWVTVEACGPLVFLSIAEIKNLPMAVAFAGLQGALVKSLDPFLSFLSKFALDLWKDGTSHKWGYLRQDFSEKVHMVEGM